MPENRTQKPTDVEALFFFFVFLTALLIFCNRFAENTRHATWAGIALFASAGVVVFVWRKIRA